MMVRVSIEIWVCAYVNLYHFGKRKTQKLKALLWFTKRKMRIKDACVTILWEVCIGRRGNMREVW